MKTKLYIIYIRILTGLSIMFRTDHWFIVWISDAELKSSLKDEPIELNITAHKLHLYNVKKIIHDAGKDMDQIELMCDKATFYAEAELLTKK